MPRVFVIGWDGATFDLMKPWLAEGKLPTLAKLIREGSHGYLESNIPPMTFPAWSSFMTGKNQGKHGIFDFTRTRPGSYQLEFVNGGQRKAASIWQILSEANRRVISISVPGTFPPEPVNGFMISGFDAPGLGGKETYVDARGMYPPTLYDEIQKNVGGHPVNAFIIHAINKGRPDLAIEQVLRKTREKAATAKYLMTNHPWDCFMIHFGELDGVSHHFWKYCDPQSPLFEKDPPGLQDSLFKVYQEYERQAAELMERMPSDTVVMLMSDHGFGGVSNWLLYPNCWLQEKGWLRFRGRFARWKSRTLDALKLRLVARLPGRFKRFLYRVFRSGFGKFEANVRYSILNWSRTQAYFEENPYYPVLWLNVKGRQPQGTVEPGREYEVVRDRLIKDLESWKHPVTGKPIVEKAYRREEVYSGPYLEEAADIIPKWALHQGYNYSFRLSSKSKKLAWVEELDPHQPHNMPYFTGKSGTHRDYGIMVAHGPGIRPGVTVDGARIFDLAPTILQLLGEPIPDDMDGRVLQEMFTQPERSRLGVEETTRRPYIPVAVSQNGFAGDHDDPSNGYTPEDEETVAARLKALGYVE